MLYIYIYMSYEYFICISHIHVWLCNICVAFTIVIEQKFSSASLLKSVDYSVSAVSFKCKVKRPFLLSNLLCVAAWTLQFINITPLFL